MVNRDTFSSFHPLVNFLYFVLVFAFSMCFMHPFCLLISLISALSYSTNLQGKKALLSSLKYMLPMLIMAAVLNPAFNHEGATILRYLPSGNPLTLESILYGIAAAVMLISVLLWFQVFNEVITSDKFVYLFGRIIPALSLVLSMTLRFVPRFSAQTKEVTRSQQCLGRDVSSGSVVERLKKAVTILSIMVTWSLENAVETADSMKSRGYGLSGRTAFSIYRFDDRDKVTLLWLLFCGSQILWGSVSGCLYFRYYPTVKWGDMNPFSFSFFLLYLMLCLTPVIINLKEAATWKSLQSTI